MAELSTGPMGHSHSSELLISTTSLKMSLETDYKIIFLYIDMIVLIQI